MTMMRVLLVPHGQTPWNEAGRFQGHTDVGMNPRGFEQARRLAESLRDEKIAAIVSSDLKRATETATPVSQLFGLPLRTDARLRELRFGAWEGLTGAEIALAIRPAGSAGTWARPPIFPAVKRWMSWAPGSAPFLMNHSHPMSPGPATGP